MARIGRSFPIQIKTKTPLVRGVNPNGPVYKSGCDSLTGWTSYLSSGCTFTVDMNGYCGNCFDLSQPNNTSNENAIRQDFSNNNYRIFSFRFALSTNVSGESCICHAWSDGFVNNIFEVRVVQGGSNFNLKLSNAASSPTTVTGTTNLSSGIPYKVTVEVTDTTLKLWLDETVAPECSLTGQSYTTYYIGPVDLGQYYANGVNGHIYFDDIYISPALSSSPTTISGKVSDSWSGWKQRYVLYDGTSSATVVRPKTAGNGTTDGADTVSEGIGYGLMLAVQNNDQTTFDMVERWVRSNLDRTNNSLSSPNLMAWHYDPFGTQHKVLDWNNAADGDLQRCLAFMWAHSRVKQGQWSAGTLSYTYVERAMAIAADMKANLFNSYGGKQYLCGDLTQKGVNPFEMATSYLVTVLFRRLYQYSQDPFWLQAIEGAYDTCYQSQSNILDKSTSAWYPPDWNFFNTSTGLVGADTNGGRESKYEYNAIRTPFWMWLEWQWYKETRWQSLLNGNYFTNLNSYYNSNSSTLAAQYNHDGTLDGSAYEKTMMYALDYFVFHAASSLNAPTIYTNKVTNTYQQHQGGSYWSDNASTNGLIGYFENSWTLMPVMAKEGLWTNIGQAPTSSIRNFVTTIRKALLGKYIPPTSPPPGMLSLLGVG